MTLDEEFEKYVELGNNMPPQTADNMLIAYSYFKQATIGNNTEDRPLHSNVVRTFKHDAWMQLKNMPKDEAKQKYIDHIKEMLSNND